MSYWDEELGQWLDAEPHYDSYFQDEPKESVSADLLLAIESLEPKQKFVLELRYGLRHGALGREFSQREIAELMGVSQSAVCQLEDSAVKSLSDLINSGTTAP